MNKLKYDYTILTPFKLCVLENFPFIEADFDTLTNYQIMCKMVEYMNSISKNQNLVQTNMIELNNWFNNLDVQEEINNKLDSMAESGELQEIIESYLNTNCIVAFNTLNDLKNGENLIDGSFACIYGLETLYDGKGAFYKIKTITSSDIVDNINKVALNTSETLIAVKINNFYIDEINNNLNLLINKKYIFIGDSYLEGYSPDGTIENWGIKLVNILGLQPNQYQIVAYGGSGFTREDTKTFEQMISELNNDELVTDIVVCGGYNDVGSLYNNLFSKMTSFKSIANSKFPNAKIHIGHIGWSKNYRHIYPLSVNISNYKKATKSLGLHYLSNVEYILKDMFAMLSSDDIHPNSTGQEALAIGILSAINTGDANVNYPFKNIGIQSNYTIESAGNFYASVINGQTTIGLNEIMRITLSNPITLNADKSALEIGTITDGYAIGTEYNTVGIPVSVVIGYSGGYATITGKLTINGGKVYLYLYNTNTYNNANAFGSFTEVYLIQIMGATISMDSTLC